MTPISIDPGGEETSKIVTLGLKILAYAGTFLFGIISATWAVAIKFKAWEARLDAVETSLKGMECIGPEECVAKHTESQKMIQMQFDSGAKEFDEIKKMIQAIDKKNDEQHQFLIEQLLSGGRRK